MPSARQYFGGIALLNVAKAVIQPSRPRRTVLQAVREMEEEEEGEGRLRQQPRRRQAVRDEEAAAAAARENELLQQQERRRRQRTRRYDNFVPFEGQCQGNADGSPKWSASCDGHEDLITMERIAPNTGCCIAGHCYGNHGRSLAKWARQEERRGRVPRDPFTNKVYDWMRSDEIVNGCTRGN